jgi:PST family polysaccharide transporter/lipopolysaccharide exporter
MAAGIVVTADPFVRGILGNDWTPTIPLIQVFAIVAAMRAMLPPFGTLLEVNGYPDIAPKLQVLGIIVIAILIYSLTEMYGVVGTAVATGGRMFVFIPAMGIISLRLLNIQVRRFVPILVPPFIASVGMMSTVQVLRNMFMGSALIEFFISVIAGIVIYTCFILMIDRWFDLGIQKSIQRMSANLSTETKE